MGWWPLRLSAKILALLRLSVNFFQLRLTKKLKINFFCFKELNINKPVFFVSLSKIKVLGSSLDEISYLIDHTPPPPLPLMEVSLYYKFIKEDVISTTL